MSRENRETFTSHADKLYADKLIMQTTLRWNLLISAIFSGRTAKLSHMDVLEANKDFITAGNKETGKVDMIFHREDILRQGVAQIVDFDIRFFDEKGMEIKSNLHPDMELKGAKPIKSRHRNNDSSPDF